MAEENKNVKKDDKKIVKAAPKKPPVGKQGKDGKEKVKFGTKVKNFFRDYKSELKRIVWPTRADVIRNTGVVLVAIIFVAAIVGVLDLVFGLGIRALGNIR